MYNLSEREILKFLDGRASEKKLAAIKDWAYESEDNAEDLALAQRIFKEADHISTFNVIDEDQEWSSFLNATNESLSTISPDLDEKAALDEDYEVSDNDLLNYIDGQLTYSERTNVEKWKDLSEENNKDFELTKLITSELSQMESFRNIDLNREWASFNDKISVAKVVPLGSSSQAVSSAASNRTFIIPMWMRYASAAAIAILLGSFFWFNRGDNYSTYTTQNNTHAFNMVDGSHIQLAENSTLRYPKSLRNVNERRLYLDGHGEFDVASNKEKPFVVEVSNRIGIEVLGTIFKVFDHQDFVEAVENIEGKVRAYSLENPEIYVELGPGDRYGWNGENFVDLNIPEEVDNSVEYQILYVLDYLMANSSWRVISSPNMPFEENGMVKVDLDKPIEKLLEDLKERADFEYIEMDCDNCYRITRFAQD